MRQAHPRIFTFMTSSIVTTAHLGDEVHGRTIALCLITKAARPCSEHPKAQPRKCARYQEQ